MRLGERHLAVVLLVDVEELDETLAQEVLEAAHALVQLVHVTLRDARLTLLHDYVWSAENHNNITTYSVHVTTSDNHSI